MPVLVELDGLPHGRVFFLEIKKGQLALFRPVAPAHSLDDGTPSSPRPSYLESWNVPML